MARGPGQDDPGAHHRPETGRSFRSLSATLQRVTDLGPILASLGDGEVVFIDEIHRLPPPVGEMLYTVMEDFRLDLVVGEPGNTRSVSIPLARFTLVGATTMSGMLQGPLRARFGVVFIWTPIPMKSWLPLLPAARTCWA